MTRIGGNPSKLAELMARPKVREAVEQEDHEALLGHLRGSPGLEGLTPQQLTDAFEAATVTAFEAVGQAAPAAGAAYTFDEDGFTRQLSAELVKLLSVPPAPPSGTCTGPCRTSRSASSTRRGSPPSACPARTAGRR